MIKRKLNLSEIRDADISILEDEACLVFFDEELPEQTYGFPEIFLIELLDDNTVKVTPKDNVLDDIHTIIQDIEKYPYTVMITQIDFLVSTISTIRKFSTTEAQFEFENGEHNFHYSFTLAGNTIGEIFDQINVIYGEIGRGFSDDETLVIDNFLSKIN